MATSPRRKPSSADPDDQQHESLYDNQGFLREHMVSHSPACTRSSQTPSQPPTQPSPIRSHQTPPQNRPSIATSSQSRGLSHTELFGGAAAVAASGGLRQRSTTMTTHEDSLNSLLALKSRRHVDQLERDVRRLTYAENFGDNLIQAANLIHNELRSAFHQLPLTPQTAEYIESLCRILNDTLERWMAEVSALDNAVLASDVSSLPDIRSIPAGERDVAAERWRSVTLAWKDFAFAIPTEAAARQQRLVAQRLRNLFRDEVQAPLAMATTAGTRARNLSASEAQAQAWIADVASRLAQVFSSADALLDATVQLWHQFDLRIGVSQTPLEHEGSVRRPGCQATKKPWERFRAKTRGRLRRMMSGLKLGEKAVPEKDREREKAASAHDSVVVGAPALAATTFDLDRGDVLNLPWPGSVPVPGPGRGPEMQRAEQDEDEGDGDGDGDGELETAADLLRRTLHEEREEYRAQVHQDTIEKEDGREDKEEEQQAEIDDEDEEKQTEAYLAHRARQRAATLSGLNVPAFQEFAWMAETVVDLERVEGEGAESQVQR